MNSLELRNAVRARNGIPDTGDGLAGHPDIDLCIRVALTEISAEKRWPWLLTSTPLTFSTSTGKATLPASVAQIHKLTIGGLEATRGSLDEYLVAARQFIWADLGGELGLTPIPTTVPTAVLWYYRNEPAFTKDTDSPLLPDTFHGTLIARASYLLNVRRGESKRQALDLTDYQAGLKNMMQVTQRGFGPSTVGSAFRVRNQASW